ncbi:hypothetical protein KI688_000746 [Linnemannia hyalina]|uniref:FAD-binding domain-containing protein n=1 Tax=Linnemannia hyalina TaxID=64524 RepID=A0A9P7Y4T3_9FUNG|nr:hypothetical protein KI688_000746 [Linnemannia hyalina]
MSETRKQLTVMIVGAGLGGLTLALLLEKKAKIGYHVYERAAEVKPLGLTSEFYMISKIRYITVHKENDSMRPMGRVYIEEHIERISYTMRVCTRPEFYSSLQCTSTNGSSPSTKTKTLEFGSEPPKASPSREMSS